jgi:hypothetical protein
MGGHEGRELVADGEVGSGDEGGGAVLHLDLALVLLVVVVLRLARALGGRLLGLLLDLLLDGLLDGGALLLGGLVVVVR